MTQRWLSAWGLAAVGFGGASLLVPLYVVALGGDAFTLGVLFASASFVGVPGALAFGTLADRTGRRRDFVLASMVVTVATTVSFPLLDSIPAVIVVNAVLWLAFAAAGPVLTLLVVAGEPADARPDRIARLNRIQGLGWTGGLALGVVVLAGGSAIRDPLLAQRAFFLVCAACAAAGLFVAVRTLPRDSARGREPPPARLRRGSLAAGRFNVRGAAFPFTPHRFDPRQLHPGRLRRRFTPRLGTFFVALLLAFTGFGVFFAPLPAFLGAAGYGADHVFGFYLLVNVGAVASFGRAAAIARTYDLARVHVGGLVVRAVVFPLVGVVGAVGVGRTVGLGTLVVGFLVVGLSWAVITVTAAALVTTLAPEAIRGEALGAYGALVAVGGGVGGLLGGWIASFGYLVAFGVAGGLVLAGASLVAVLFWRATPVATPLHGTT